MSAIFDSPCEQLFSIPYHYILYIIEEPASPEGLQNLYQTCKFFYAKNPILFPTKLLCYENSDYYGDCIQNCRYKFKARFWPMLKLCILGPPSLNKFYRICPKYLVIQTNISLADFTILVAENTIEKFHISGPDEILGATADVVLGKLPNATKFNYYTCYEVYSNEIFQNLIKLERKTVLRKFGFNISEVSDNFSVSNIVEFLKHFGVPGSTFKFGIANNLRRLMLELEKELKTWKTVEVNVEDGSFYDHIKMKFL